MKVTSVTECVFETWSGSTYEICCGKVRKLNPGTDDLKSGDWAVLSVFPEIEVGERAFLIMERLTPQGEVEYTSRRTTEVVGIEMREV